MDRISSLNIERFKRLPRASDERWQGGLVRLPSWVLGEPGGRPYRPWAGFWVSRATGMIHFKMAEEPAAADWSLALDALIDFGLKGNLVRCRPAGLEVRDEHLGARLRDALGDRDLTVALSPDLPAVSRALADMADHLEGRPLPPAALQGPGVTVARMRAFAEAATRFYEAAPWRHLTDEDLIAVEAPEVHAGLRHVTVLGAGGQTYGLGFFDSPEQHEALLAGMAPEEFLRVNPWSVWFGTITEMPFGDVDLWEDHHLPVAGEAAYPVALRVESEDAVRRPDASMLAHLEGLLRALAGTTEDEIDQGRWVRGVQTYDGPVNYELCIPALLEPLDAPRSAPAGGMPDRRAIERMTAEIDRFLRDSHFQDLDEVNDALQREFSGPLDARPSTATTPLERAQDLVYRAFEARGRRRTQLARKALELSADCADAYVVLGEQTSEPERARDWYAQGVAAGERALGPETFAEQAGHFWGLVKTRPYMRARQGLAQCLEAIDAADEAIGHYRELLRLNPDDNQGVRELLLPVLLATGRDDEAGTLLRQCQDDATALWQYGWALWLFRREGDSPPARDRVRRALKANRQVSRYVMEEEAIPDVTPSFFSLGGGEEAVLCARALAEVWRGTPGAQSWLARHARTKRGGKRRRR